MVVIAGSSATPQSLALEHFVIKPQVRLVLIRIRTVLIKKLGATGEFSPRSCGLSFIVLKPEFQQQLFGRSVSLQV